MRRKHRLRPFFLALPLVAAGCANPADDEAWLSRHLFTAEGPIDPTGLPAIERPTEGKVARLVQFQGRIRPDLAEAVRAAGAEVRGYFPENALLIRADGAAAKRIEEIPDVRAVTEQLARWRVDPRLRLGEPAEAIEVVVEVVEGEAPAAVEAAIVSSGGEVLGAHGWLIDARIRRGDAERLAGRADVAYVEKRPVFTVANDEARLVLGAGATPETLANGLTGRGQLVAVADSGVDTAACFFEGEKIAAYVGEPGDENGHGTHVAASIAGDRFANGEADEQDGMAPGARLFVQDVGSAGGETLDLIPRDLGRLFGPAYEAGARIHSDSWGTDGATYGSTARSLDLFVESHPDFLVLVANGNSGPEPGSVGSPATAKNLLSVGASGSGGSASLLASFSSRGPTSDGRLKPTLVAPGSRILSAAAGEDCSVVAKSGTSMATPILAGAAALVREYFAEGWYPSGAPSPADERDPSAALLRATLIAGAVGLDPESAEGSFPSDGQGFGRADVSRSLFFAGEGSGERLWIRDGGSELAVDEGAAFRLEVEEGRSLRVALAWTDRAAPSGTTRALVNDLDLVVEGPDGETWRGNAMLEGISVVDGRADRTNVEEIVHLRDVAPGTYTVRVEAANVPEGTQAFALAAVGPIVGSSDTAVEPVPEPGPAPRDDDPWEDAARRAGCGAAGGSISLLGILASAFLLRRRR